MQASSYRFPRAIVFLGGRLAALTGGGQILSVLLLSAVLFFFFFFVFEFPLPL